MDSDINDITQRIETQLSKFEESIREAGSRIKRIERSLNARIVYARKLIYIMNKSQNPMVLSQIVDILGDIERISDKLINIDITPSGHKETSLESLTEQEYDEMEALLA